jgi:hypothetical protein
VGPVDLGMVDRVDLGSRADLGTVDLAVLVGLLDRADLVDRAGLVVLADLVVMDLVGRADPRRRRTRPRAPTIAGAHKWADPRMRRTDSAHPTTVHRLRPGTTDSGGMADLLQERRRQTGTGRRLQVAGTVRPLPVVGTTHGMGRRAT